MQIIFKNMEARVVRAMGIMWVWLGDKCIMSNAYDCETKKYHRLTKKEQEYCMKNDKVKLKKTVTETSFGVTYVKFTIVLD